MTGSANVSSWMFPVPGGLAVPPIELQVKQLWQNLTSDSADSQVQEKRGCIVHLHPITGKTPQFGIYHAIWNTIHYSVESLK